jgi:RHS repeat-associated protein
LTGREPDQTALAYYRARYYDPKLGRFLSEDPIGFLGGPNFYAYALNRPTNLVDPLGLESGNINKLVPGPDAPVTPLPPGNPIDPATGYFGAEGHFFGGGGLTSVTCFDGCGKKKTFRYVKVCLGGAMGAGLGGGNVTGMSGASCRADSYTGWFFETGFSKGVVSGSADFGYSSGPFGLPGLPSGVNEGGLGLGLGFKLKASWCYYIQIP